MSDNIEINTSNINDTNNLKYNSKRSDITQANQFSNVDQVSVTSLQSLISDLNSRLLLLRRYL